MHKFYDEKMIEKFSEVSFHEKEHDRQSIKPLHSNLHNSIYALIA